jgi:hypothetical protein
MQGSGTLLEMEGAEGKTMATIDQPTPSNPGSPKPDRQPLQPGGPPDSRPNATEPQRPNEQTPESASERNNR